MPAYSLLKARLCDQIHPLSDLVAQIVLQSYITNEAERLLKIDEQIQIAVILLFASHERAEDADLFDLKPMPKDWLFVSKNTLDLLKGFHLFLGTTKGRIVNKYDERLIFRLVIKISVRNGQAVFSACCSLPIPSSPASHSRAPPSHAGPLAPGPRLPAPVRVRLLDCEREAGLRGGIRRAEKIGNGKQRRAEVGRGLAQSLTQRHRISAICDQLAAPNHKQSMQLGCILNICDCPSISLLRICD